MIDPKYLAEIKAREQNATPGPWDVGDGCHERFFAGRNSVISPLRVVANRAIYDGGTFDDQTFADMSFIAHARTDIPALVEEVERLHGIESELAYEKRANETIPVMNKLVNDSAKKIKEQKNRIAILEKALETAYAEASNAIYFSDRSDYLPGLYDVCKAIKPEIEHEEIGKEYIQQAQEQEDYHD